MLEIVTNSYALLMLSAMSTLGAALLVQLFAPKATHARKCLHAALVGPLLAILPLILILEAEGDLLLRAGYLMGLLLGVGLLVGWPLAHFALKRLDRA